MQEHPFIESVSLRITGIVALMVILAVNTYLLMYCGVAQWVAVVSDSIVYGILLGASGFLYWYVTDVLRAIQAQVALALIVQALCIGGSFVVQSVVVQEELNWFVCVLPFRFMFGLACWVILVQWYRIRRIEFEVGDIQSQKEMAEIASSSLVENPALDRIPVKDGSRIHIIHLDELLYIQACGDYVTLFTISGQYLKEQTMKYFEQHLPPAVFIRIHRSCIVNTEQIVRVELFGKETYQVRLKNGDYLRVSNTGYKLLKEHLSL